MFSKNKNKNWHVLTLDGLLALTSNNMHEAIFTKILMANSFFSVSSEPSNIAMVSTHNKMAEVDTEPSSDYYDKHFYRKGR
jgi:hypothetical protein